MTYSRAVSLACAGAPSNATISRGRVIEMVRVPAMGVARPLWLHHKPNHALWRYHPDFSPAVRVVAVANVSLETVKPADDDGGDVIVWLYGALPLLGAAR